MPFLKSESRINITIIRNQIRSLGWIEWLCRQQHEHEYSYSYPYNKDERSIFAKLFHMRHLHYLFYVCSPEWIVCFHWQNFWSSLFCIHHKYVHYYEHIYDYDYEHIMTTIIIIIIIISVHSLPFIIVQPASEICLDSFMNSGIKPLWIEWVCMCEWRHSNINTCQPHIILYCWRGLWRLFAIYPYILPIYE